MRSYDEAYEAARDRSAFANGTEGEMWMSNWCERCTHDTEEKQNKGGGCPLVLVAIMQRTPSEWLDGPRDENGLFSRYDQYHCVEFRDRKNPPNDGPSRGPRPMPGQGQLIPEEPYKGVRMFADVVAEVKPAEVSHG